MQYTPWIIIVILLVILIAMCIDLYRKKHAAQDEQNSRTSDFLNIKFRNIDFAGESQRAVMLRDALATTNAGYWEGCFLFDVINVSSKLYDILGLYPDSGFNYDIGIKIVHPDDNERINVDIMSELMVTEEPVKYEYRVITPQGKLKYIEAYSQLIVDDSNNITGVHGIIRDISELKMLEYSLFENEDCGLSDCVKLEPKPFDVTMMMNDIFQLLQPFAAAKKLRLEIEQPESMIPVLDEVRLRQVVAEVIYNAIKFTREGGVEVKVSSKLEPDSNIGEFTITVFDTGVGISKDKLDAIFEPETQSRHECRTPLGLLFAKQSIVAMGGDITVESAPGKGSIFSINIPYVGFMLPMGKINSSANKRMAYFEPARVIITSSIKYMQNIRAYILRRNGLTSVPVDSAQEALEKIEQPGSKIALAIIDIRTPDINSSIVKKLCHAGKIMNIPIVALAASEDEAKELCADFAAVVQNPINTSRVANTLKDFLPSQIF